MTSARVLEKLHKVNYYVPHVHLMRIKEGPGRHPAVEASLSGGPRPYFLRTCRDRLETHNALSLSLFSPVVVCSMKKRSMAGRVKHKAG